ncbi:MAG TPA: alpha/beta hydrolase [Candidatus Sulfotelmatobacter sp.]|jgi:pimeloyl-ACP methyl ester carboxylesterase|nr:alpha/beta hydrolase [Candidatus Sulfotelmatobacter sp.]
MRPNAGRRLRFGCAVMPNATTSSPPARPLIRRIIFGLLLLVVLLAAAGFLYENIAEARDRRFNRMPGTLVNVGGGRKMHISCIGEGTPTVILDSGLGDTYASWRKVQPEIAKFSQVCSYDRAGLGYSTPSPDARTSNVIARELHGLLQSANIVPPYVLVGHSMGGYNVRLYASLYHNEVAGMVLVDSSHPDQDNRFPPELKKMEGNWLREAELMEYTMPFGIPRLLGMCDRDPVVRAAECNFHSAREGIAEMKAFPESAAQTAATGPLGDLPLAVLSQDPDKPSSELPPELAKPVSEEWAQMQKELAHLSIRGTRTVAKNSAHYIQIDRPEIVIEAVQNVVEQSRKAQAKPDQSAR